MDEGKGRVLIWTIQNLNYIQYTVFYQLLNYCYIWFTGFWEIYTLTAGYLKKPLQHSCLATKKSVYLCAYWLVGPLLRWHSKAKTTVQPSKSRVLGFNRIILICFTQPQLIFFAKHGQFNYFFMRWNGAKYEGSVLD